MIKLLVLDCDGVLSAGESQPLDLKLLARLADLNRQAQQGEAVPAVTVNTGRPSAYVEAIMQAIHGWQPALYESGAGLYLTQSYRFQTTPLFSPDLQASLQKALKQIDQAIVQPNYAYWQPGKTVNYTLLAIPPYTLADFISEVKAIVGTVSPELAVTTAKKALNIHPAGISKGTGLRWLAEVSGIALADMAGIGDTSGDIPFLELTGFSAAPANAIEEVKAVVEFVATQPDAAGTCEILQRWGLV